MKKLFAVLMTVLFLGSTGLVLADEATTPSTTPVVKTLKHKKAKKVRKAKKMKATAAPVVSNTPAAK